MTTVPPIFMSTDFPDEDNLISILEDNSLSLLFGNLEEEEEGKDNKKIDILKEELSDLELISEPKNADYDNQENNELEFDIYTHSIFICFINVFNFICTMLNSDINHVIELLSKIFELLSQMMTKKVLRQILLTVVLIVALVHSRGNGGFKSFETNRLFPSHSVVTDFFQGELSLLRDEIMRSDLTLVMYYAPWDRQSLNLAPHFLQAAKYHYEQVSFAAINCWLPRSQCQAAYKFHYFPIVVLHVKISALDESVNVPYNGPLSAHHLIRFVSSALRPFTYVSEETQLLTLQLQYDALVLGYYKVGSFDRKYLSFYYSAISKLQYEHLSNVRYVLVTNPTMAERLSLSHPPSIHLVTWNTTLMFPESVDKIAKNISSFVEIHLSEVLQWLHISGRKSLTLNRVFQEGPFLVLFSQDNPYHRSNDAFIVAKAVAMEYHSCNPSPVQTWLIDTLHPKTMDELLVSDNICRNYIKNRAKNRPDVTVDFHSYETDGTDTCGKEELIYGTKNINSLNLLSWNTLLTSFLASDPIPFSGYWFNARDAGSCSSKNESMKTQGSKRKHSGKSHFEKCPVEDDKVAQLIDWAAEERCKMLVLGSKIGPPSIIPKTEDQKVNITGLGCRTNRTLKFIMVDSLLHRDFAYQLGVNLSSDSNNLSGAAIIDPEMEERYIFEQPLSRNGLASFVYNFTNNILTRGKLLTSTSWKGKTVCSGGAICMLELDSNCYKNMLHSPNQAIIVLHYSHQCGACSAIGSILLTCQHLVSNVANLTFARIDVSKNTLPWHLSFAVVPTIIFYPRNRQSQSRVFDQQMPVTVKNLMAFILAGLGPPERNAVAYKLCNSECRKATVRQSLVTRLKLHHQIGVLKSRHKRIIAHYQRVKLQANQQPDKPSLQSLCDFYMTLDTILSKRLTATISKLRHIDRVVNLYRKEAQGFQDSYYSQQKNARYL